MTAFVRTLLVGGWLVWSLSLSSPAQLILVDFGRHDGVNGNATTSPDANGNNWNNANIPGGVVGGVTLALDLVPVDSLTGTGIDIVTLGDPANTVMQGNGILNGGLLDASQSGSLGVFDVDTATQDYAFFNAAASFRLTGLDPNLIYSFTFFGSRYSTGNPDTRVTLYTVNGLNSGNDSLQTTGVDLGTNLGGPISGTGQGNVNIYDGNDSQIASVSGIQPFDAGGGVYAIDITFQNTAGAFGYLNAMSIQGVPEPSTAVFALLGMFFLKLATRRHRRPA